MMNAIEIATSALLSFGQVVGGGGNAEAIVRHAGLQVIHADGTLTLRLKEVSRETADGADGAKETVIALKDESYDFFVRRHVVSYGDCEAVETWNEIENREEGAVRLVRMDSLAVRLPGDRHYARVFGLTGVWASEANVHEGEVAEGQIVELSAHGGNRNAWESNAGMMVSLEPEACENRGEVLGVALEWTGNTCRRVRHRHGGGIEVFAGVDNFTGPYVLDAGKTVVTPKAIVVCSAEGRGGVSRRFHRWARLHLLPHGRELNPVLLNSWEGSYFSFTEQTLTDMMDGVKEMGGELFVLDDGWFGHGKYARDDVHRDRVGLGDWHVNPEKLPHGLGWLGEEAAKRSLKFGFWVEPEMVNTESWIAEAHPDWLLREPKRELVLGRGGTQTVLDFTNPAVVDDLFGQMDRAMGSVKDLAYVKWDSNQHISNPGSTYLDRGHQANVWFDHQLGVYELARRLRAKYPSVWFQACASGGAHADFGFLRYADEFWGSDNTDPASRVFIQWGESQFYPAKTIGAHVTASPNHQTGRTTPLKFRFDVAMTGRFGFELHPKNLSAEELAFAKSAVGDYKRIRPVVQLGDLYRLASPYENPYSSLMYVSEDRTRAAFFVLGLDNPTARSVRRTIRLEGLDPEKRYVVNEINRGKKLHGAFDRRVETGRRLMDEGLSFTLGCLYDSLAVEIVEKP